MQSSASLNETWPALPRIRLPLMNHLTEKENPAVVTNGTYGEIARLVPLASNGDEAATRQLVDELYPLIATIVRTYLPRQTEPEDLMQEVFIKLLRRLGQFRNTCPFRHWAATVART